MNFIDATKVVVNTFEDLKEILEGDNSYETIYFGSSIKLKSPITILPTKKRIILDGSYRSFIGQYEDMDSNNPADNIGIRKDSAMEVTVRNMKITGHNSYGIIYTDDSADTSKCVITYENVTYTGSQISHNSQNLVRFIDCNITVPDSSSFPGYVSLCHQVEFGGTCLINHSTDKVMFSFNTTTNSFTVLEYANITINCSKTELFISTNPVAMEFQKGSSFNLTTANGMSADNNSTADVIIHEAASVMINQTKSALPQSTLYINKQLKMEPSSSLIMLNNLNLSIAENANIEFNVPSASMIIDNPSCLILSSFVNAFIAKVLVNFSFTFSQLNQWSIMPIDADSIDNLPQYSWYSNVDNRNITGTILASKTSVLSTTFTAAELANLPDLSKFLLLTFEAGFSMGSLPLNIYPISTSSNKIAGKTLPNGDVLIKNGVVNTKVKADSTGYFELPIITPLNIGDEIKFIATIARAYIVRNKEVKVNHPGELTIAKAGYILNFPLVSSTTNPSLSPSDSAFEFVVIDSRSTSIPWKLMASIEGTLLSGDPQAIVYEDSANKITPLDTTPLVVYEENGNGGTPKEYNIKWMAGGLLLKLTNALPADNIYRSKINWKIE